MCHFLHPPLIPPTTGWNIYILSDSHVAIKALNSFHINSKLVWDCHQSWYIWQDITRFNWCGCCDT
jgi:hypothetical protein